MNIGKNSVLVIIDAQLGNFVGNNPIYNGKNLLNKLLILINNARKSKIPIIYVQNIGGKGDPDEPGTPGFEIHPLIKPEDCDIVIQKKTPDSFHTTKLQEELDVREIRELVIGGLQTEFCVDTTCRRAFSLGYKVTLVKDAHSTWNSSQLTADEIITHHNNVLGSWFVTLKNSHEIIFSK